VSESEIDFELVTSARSLGAAPKLRRERVILPEVKTKSGKAAAFLCWELDALEYGEFQDSSRVYKDGEHVGNSAKNEDLRFLAFTLRDGNGNRLWSNLEDAKSQLGKYGKSVTSKLMVASNKANFGDRDEPSAEKNSEATPAD